MTRSSTPSKRPQTMTRPGPAASSRTRAWSSGLPRGLISSRGRGSSGGRHGVDGRGQHVGAQHHAGAAARGRIVHRAVPAEAVLADVVRVERPVAALQRLAGQGKSERAGKHLGKQGEHGGGKAHQRPPWA